MFTLIVVGYLLFFFVLLVGFYAAQQLIVYDRMWKWLYKQYEILNANEDYQREADEIINSDLPTIEQFSSQNMFIVTPILAITQILNAILIFSTLVLLTTSAELNLAIALFNALSGMAFTVMRRRRYKAEGICRGTKIIVESLDYYKQMQKITES